MKFLVPFLLLVTGCASTATVTLPLHGEKIVVPRSIERRFAPTYASGYDAAWRAYLKVYVENIDHKREFREDLASGDPNYLDGWFAGRDDFEALVRRLVAASGKEAAKATLAEALRKEPNKPPEPMSGLAPSHGSP